MHKNVSRLVQNYRCQISLTDPNSTNQIKPNESKFLENTGRLAINSLVSKKLKYLIMKVGTPIILHRTCTVAP